QPFDGQNLNARIIFVVPELGTVTPGIGGFGAHLFAWFLQSDQSAGGGLLIFNIAEQSRDITAIHSATFYLNDNFFAMDRFATWQRFFFDASQKIFSFSFVKVE